MKRLAVEANIENGLRKWWIIIIVIRRSLSLITVEGIR